MTIKIYCWLRWVFLFGLTCLLAIGCHKVSLNPPIDSQASLSETTRLIEHSLGEAEIPANPQRIVTLHDSLLLSPAIALGVKPIASTTYSAVDGIPFREVTPKQVKGIEILGDGHQPNLEKLLLLDPDLILTSNLPVHQQIYDRLSAIAPTVAVAWDNYDSFKNRFRYVARVLGKSDRANELLDKYQNRVQELRQAIGERIDTLRISVVYAYGRELSLINSPGDPVNEVLADVKLKLIPIQAEMAQRNQNLSFSLETLSEHDADFLFIIKYPNDTVEAVLDNPLWQQLKAVKSGQYAEISPRRWGGTSTVTANYILDDLFKYLVQDRSLDR